MYKRQKESTVAEIIIEEVKSPSSSSKAVAPGSTKISPNKRLIVEFPINEIRGAVVSVTRIVLVTEDELPEASATVYSI